MKTFIRKYGLMAGLAIVVISYVVFFIDQSIFVGKGFYWSRHFVFLLGMSLAVVAARNVGGVVRNTDEIDGGQEPQRDTIQFNSALTIAFGVYVIANLFFWANNYIIYNYTGDEVLEAFKAYSIQTAEQTYAIDPQEEYKKIAENFKSKTAAELSPVPDILSIFKGWAISTILGFLMSVMVALVLRRD